MPRNDIKVLLGNYQTNVGIILSMNSESSIIVKVSLDITATAEHMTKYDTLTMAL